MAGQLVFLWHMHQPDYRAGGRHDGVYTEPWVYLHAIKDYADMAWHLECHPGVRAVINFSSILIEQLSDYAEQVSSGQLRDPVLDALRRPELPQGAAARRSLSQQCLRLKRETMVRPYPAYAALEARCTDADAGDDSAFDAFDDAFLSDLLTWYHLAWCGASVKRGEPLVRHLMDKGHGFDDADRRALYDLITSVLAGILPRFRTLAEKGQVELSMTPHGHPIAPLLLDFAVAGDGAGGSLPTSARYPGGRARVRWHVEQARRLFAQVFGQAPRGVWPAEAAVSAEFLQQLHDLGFDWVAMDGATLARSLGIESAAHETTAPATWRLAGPEAPRLFVRDTRLSEYVGFEFSRRPAQEAAGQLLDGVIARLHQAPTASSPLVCLMLDGENAWEHYADNAHDFFFALYSRAAGDPRIETTTPSRYLARQGNPPPAALPSLAPGSWAGGGFSMWIGDARRNRAWDALCELKQAFDLAAPTLDSAALAEAERALGRCESSDWFWWLGMDEPVSAVLRFDALFRQALLDAYAAIGRAASALPPNFSRLGHSRHGPIPTDVLAQAMAQAIGMDITVPVPGAELSWNSHQPVGEGSPLASFLALQGVQEWLFAVPAIELPEQHRPAAFKYAEVRIALEKSNLRYFEGRARLRNGDVHPGLLAIGVGRDHTQGLADRFRLPGVIWGTCGARGEVVACQSNSS